MDGRFTLMGEAYISYFVFLPHHTQYLANACPDVWDPENTGSTVDWPEGTLECQGSAGVTACIEEEPGTIGYLEAGHGHQAGFEEIYLENRDGTKLTSLQAAARGGVAVPADIQEILPEQASDDFSTVSLINQPGEFTWPLVLMTYICVRQDLGFIESPQEQVLLKAFLQALFDDSYVQQCVDNYGFFKIDGRALNISLAAIDSLIMNNDSIPFSFEEETNVVLGAGDYTISAKRKSASEIEIDVLTAANEKLMSQVSELERLLQQTMLEVSKLAEASGSSSSSSSTEPEGVLAESPSSTTETKNGQTVAALAMSIVSILLSACALAFACGKSNSKPEPVVMHSGVAASTEAKRTEEAMA
jgi:hypothetical protein